MAEWTRVLRSSEVAHVSAPRPGAAILGAASRFPKRFFSVGEEVEEGEGLGRRRGRKLARRADAVFDSPIKSPPATAFLTAERMWRPGERRLLVRAAEDILTAHNFPVGYDPYSEIAWNRRTTGLWWSTRTPELGVEEGVQVYCPDLFGMQDLWPAWSPFEWAWRVYYSEVLCVTGRAQGMQQDWAAGFGLGMYLAEFELHQRFNLEAAKDQAIRGAQREAAAALNKQKQAITDRRRAEVVRLAKIKLASSNSPTGKQWSAPSLATEILEIWEDLDHKPAQSVVAADIRALGLLSAS